MTSPIALAIPKGRILSELHPILEKAGIVPEDSFYDEHSRALRFSTNMPQVFLIRVRSFDVPSFVAFGGAALGIAGSDVLAEFEYEDVYAPLDLRIGQCRLSLAAMPAVAQENIARYSHMRIATKYPAITRRYFAQKGIQAECIKLSGAMELAPLLGLAPRIVDLVSSGATLKANGLVEFETIMQVSSRLIVNRAALKTRHQEIGALINQFQKAVLV